MSFESDPTRGYGDDAPDDSGRGRGLADKFVSGIATLEAIPRRLGTHLTTWPRRYVEMRTAAVSGEK
ncbi:hypothetical protein [Halorussus lipolyticus]|uniref:hypothetical protein n=1 Tax=Halorussus lipolyticus TaxID=3034024 RepID=UPI0023E82E7A|nr:hypothetical protein [Halorussus sp. DT80]